MTKWYVALPFVLLGLVGSVGIMAGLTGTPSGWIIGLPALGASVWFMGTRYESTTLSRRE